MKTIIKVEELETIEQLSDLLAGTQPVAFSVISDKRTRYKWIQGELVKFQYLTLPRQHKGVVIRYLMKLSGYSRQQLTRLIGQYHRTGRLKPRQRTVAGFKKRFTEKDIRLLAAMDERHETPCGQAIKKLCERAHQVYHEDQYANLASISVSHLYNLRKSVTYSRQRRHFEKTQAHRSVIGERRKPKANGRPGYIRIDTVHQGDLDKMKGVYHINAVDEVTQFEVVCSVERISEHYLLPILKQLIEMFPFAVLGFHSDNGSEFINQRVAKLLNKLRIEFTKSRARHSNDNALVESKNGSIVRKQFGYAYISQSWASLINEFNNAHLNIYLNYHRPCFFAEIETDNKGKERKRYHYKNMMTPYEKLRSLDNAKDYLKPGMNFEILDKIASKISDNQAADQLQKARQKLFRTIHEQSLKTG
jgi:transposase InsO family protein